VQTLFLNELTEQADVVLPAATFLEQDGTTTNFHGRVQTLKQVFKPRERRDERGNTLSACAPDWMIFAKLAQLLGQDWNIRSIGALTQEVKSVPKALPAESKFSAVSYEAAPAVLPEGSLRLLSGPMLYDGGESFEFCERLKFVVPDPFISINRTDARRLGIENKATVEVKSSRGTLQLVAKVGRDVKAGTVWMPRRLRDVRSSTLIEPNASFTAVTITKIADAPPEPELTHGARIDANAAEEKQPTIVEHGPVAGQ
jgi:predicted molibdopterin-dependent oxidoreductase YjgC